MKDEELALLIDVVASPPATGGTVEERLARHEDTQAIHDMVLQYGWLCDARRWDELLELYTDDFERVLTGTLEERAKGKATMRELYEAPQLPRAASGDGSPPPATLINTYEIRHMIHPPVVRIGADATSAVAAAVYAIVATDGEGAEVDRGVHEGGYIFEFRRDPDRWRFCKMTVISENARNPLFRS